MSKGSGRAVAQGEGSEEPVACGWAESGTPQGSDEGMERTHEPCVPTRWWGRRLRGGVGDEGDDEVGGGVAEEDARGGVGCDALQPEGEFAASMGVAIVKDNEAAADVGEKYTTDVEEVEVVAAEWAVTAEVLHVEQQGELGVAAAKG